MAKKPNQSTSPGRGLIAGFLTAGLTALLYSVVFPLNSIAQYALAAGLSLVTGRVASIMFSGLDTSKKAPSMEDLPVTGDDAVDRLIKRGQDLLQQIRKEDDLIPDPVLSEKIVQLENISNRIFQTVVEQPGKAPQIRRFMDYYLPTTLKMLTGYRRLNERGIRGENAQATKERIESAMDVVLGAFKKQLETLYQNDMLDITTDIDVLEAMLKQDSLLGSDFHMQKNTTANTSAAPTGQTGAMGQAAAQAKEEQQ